MVSFASGRGRRVRVSAHVRLEFGLLKVHVVREKNGEKHLVDLGSRAHKRVTSSYLGELESIVWACKRTKTLWGSVPLTIRTDSHSIIDKIKSGKIYDSDIRIFRKWEWLVANEPEMKMEFISGTSNKGADLLDRPQGECYVVSVRRVGFGEVFCDLQCHDTLGEPLGSCTTGCTVVSKGDKVPEDSKRLVQAHEVTFMQVDTAGVPYEERSKMEGKLREEKITKKTPRKLWAATSAEIREAKILLDKAREKVNQRLKTHPEALAVGDIVLMYDHGRVKKRRHKLLPRWQGPYILEEKLPGGSWKLQSVKMHERGRRPILVSHESYLQLFDDRDFVW